MSPSLPLLFFSRWKPGRRMRVDFPSLFLLPLVCAIPYRGRKQVSSSMPLFRRKVNGPGGFLSPFSLPLPPADPQPDACEDW